MRATEPPPGCTYVKDEGNLITCGEPEVVRFGVRCRNGCLGEGTFERGCPEHVENVEYAYRSVNENADGWHCRTCKATGSMEVFPLQPVSS